MSTKTVRAFHYTRMTDDEVDRLRTRGVTLTSVDFLRERIDRRVEAGDLSRRLGDQIVSRTALDNPEFGTRDGFWLSALPIPIDDGSVNLLLQHWGGESAYWTFQTGTEDSVLDALRRIGRARIIELQVPIASVLFGDTGGGTASNILDVYAKLLGIQRYPYGRDLNVIAPLPSSSILRVHNEGETDFHCMGTRYPATFVPLS